jgi:hypothetical protein
MDGICTLANDRVYDQLIALLNSIQATLGSEIPVWVYPYDDNTSKIAAEIARRPNVNLYQNRDVIARWEEFARQVWDTHPTAKQSWQKIGSETYHRLGTHRRYCAFEGESDRFIYMDADTLLLGSVAPIFQQLDRSDWVVYDFQHKDPSHVYDLAAPKLNTIFSPERIASEIFCSGFYASKKGMFPLAQREFILAQLRAGEAEILYPMAADQPILNYMVMKLGISSYNFALQLPESEKTGCCVTSPHFIEKDFRLYDKERPLTYLHYIGLSSQLFARVCQGENIDFPYRDLFLHYRYLHEPEKRPKFTTKPKAYNQPPNLMAKVMRKLRLNN